MPSLTLSVAVLLGLAETTSIQNLKSKKINYG